ncbi:MAG: DUF5947 family protein [Acidimicrobiales bacterium]
MTDAPLAVLQQIRAARAVPSSPPGERCDLCGEAIDEAHGHLVDLQARSLLCACRGCRLLFDADGAGGGHFRAVPDRYRRLPLLEQAAALESLQIPVGVAFFFVNSTLGRVAAFYPGPAGATESELALDTWEEVAGADPNLATLRPDVEAVIVRTGRAGGTECFIVPIDACYELVGELRRRWRGFDGGAEARSALDGFFAAVRERAT